MADKKRAVETEMKKSREKRCLAGWFFVAADFLILLLFSLAAPSVRPLLPMIGLVGNMLISLWLAWEAFGVKKSLCLWGISFVVTMILENLSMATGFPYGVFEHFLPGPRLGTVPLVIGFVYFNYCVIGWIFADLLIGDISGDRVKLLGRPAIAAFVGAAMDALYDPIGSLLLKQWQYPDGGGFFGVPLRNTIGWLVNLFLTLLLFETVLFVFRKYAPPTDCDGTAKPFHLQNSILLLLQPVPALLCWKLLPDETVAGCTGMEWSSAALYETVAVLGILIMGSYFSAGALRYYQRKKEAAILLEKNNRW